MKYTKIGQTALEVSKICLGTMTFGEQSTQEEAYNLMDIAHENGVNFYDTAEMYSVPGRKETQGDSERILGSWIKDRELRNELVIATKITGPSTGLSYIRNPLNFSKEQIRTAIEGSLQRLQTDYVDIYQLHWPERANNRFGKRNYEHFPNEKWEDNFHEILVEMTALVKEGKIRHFGVSNETPWGLMHFLQLAKEHGLTRVASIQNPYSLLNRIFEIGLAEIAMREQVSLLPYSPLGFGTLSGKYDIGEQDQNYRIHKYPTMSRYNSPQSRGAARQYNAIAQKHGMTPAQMALAFVNSRPFTGGNIIGATSPEQLLENISSVDIDLSHEVMKEIEVVHAAIPNPAP